MTRVEETAQLVEWLSCKRDDLSSVLQYPQQSQV